MNRLTDFFDNPGKALHRVVGTPGFSMPSPTDLQIYDLNNPADVDTAKSRHKFQVGVAPDKHNNVLAVHRNVKAPRLRLTYAANGCICVLGPNANVTGALELCGDRVKMVISGGSQQRALSLNIGLRADGQKFFWGENSTAEGVHASVKGRRAALVVGDDCMMSWQVWFRPSDMHAIVALDTDRILNPAEDIIVGPHVWIGQSSLLLKGARIGAGSIIGGKSLVLGKRSYRPMSIYAGNPATLVRTGATWDREHDESAQMFDRVRTAVARYADSLPVPYMAEAQRASTRIGYVPLRRVKGWMTKAVARLRSTTSL